MGSNLYDRGVLLPVLALVVGVMIRITPYCSGEPLGLIQGNIPGRNTRQQQQQQQLQQNSGINTGAGGLFGGALNRQGGGGLSFAIPGLSLLGGNNGVGGGGNIFGVATVTRTVVSTVSTVTTASFRTCIAPTNMLMPCVAGRRRRRDALADSADEENQVFQPIQPTPVMALIIGSTTVKDPDAVTEYLEAHKPSTQSVIYPPGVEQVISEKLKINPRLEMEEEVTTLLYPSHDTPEQEVGSEEEEDQHHQDQVFSNTAGTETPKLLNDDADMTTYSPESDDNLQENDDNLSALSANQARLGLGRTTTVTSVIRVTSVATSLATGMMATLTVSYAGCLPQSLPISGLPCP